jgi:hypothetical protein
MNKHKNILLRFFTIGIMLVFAHIGIAQNNPNIKVNDQCFSNTRLEPVNSGSAYAFTWLVYKASNNELLAKSTTREPKLSFASSTSDSMLVRVELECIYEDTISTTDMEFYVFNGPAIKVKHWDDLICSNSDTTYYEVEQCNGCQYHWNISDLKENGYIKYDEGSQSHQLKILWNEFNNISESSQFDISCEVTSNYGNGVCASIYSDAIILLPHSVPTEELKIEQKSGDENLFFLITKNPDEYLYEWGFINHEGEENAYSTTDSYHRYESYDASMDYYVDVLNKDFNFCKTRIWYNPQQKSGYFPTQENPGFIEVLNLYPNPTSTNINIDLIKNYPDLDKLTVTIINFMGSVKATYQFNMDKDVVKYKIPSHYLESGHYTLRFSALGYLPVTKKFIVINN